MASRLCYFADFGGARVFYAAPTITDVLERVDRDVKLLGSPRAVLLTSSEEYLAATTSNRPELEPA